MTALNENAPLTGQGAEWGSQQVNFNKSILQNRLDCNTVPAWMAEKVIAIVKKLAKAAKCTENEALQRVSGEAFITISAEAKAVNAELPVHLARALAGGTIAALDAFEMSALIITENDSQACAPACNPADVAEFTALRLEALRQLLETEGAQDVC